MIQTKSYTINNSLSIGEGVLGIINILIVLTLPYLNQIGILKYTLE
jgi:hypothetical protein